MQQSYYPVMHDHSLIESLACNSGILRQKAGIQRRLLCSRFISISFRERDTSTVCPSLITR